MSIQITSTTDSEKDVTAAIGNLSKSDSKEEKSVYSLFGGIGNNKTEEYIRVQQAMQVCEKLHTDKIITDTEYTSDMKALYKQLKAAVKPQKLLGVIPIAERGCSIINGCGLLTW